jgi:hypothetical protein
LKPIRTGGENVYPEEVEAVLRYQLTGFKVPREVLAIATIPRDGKRVDYVWARTTTATLFGSPADP